MAPRVVRPAALPVRRLQPERDAKASSIPLLCFRLVTSFEPGAASTVRLKSQRVMDAVFKSNPVAIVRLERKHSRTHGLRTRPACRVYALEQPRSGLYVIEQLVASRCGAVIRC